MSHITFKHDYFGPLQEAGENASARSLLLVECRCFPDNLNDYTNLEELSMHRHEGSKLVLPPSIMQLTKLTSLYLYGCYFDEILPEGVGGLAQLQQLHLHNCSELSCLPDSITQLTKLTKLHLQSCSSLQGLPEGVGDLVQLQQLNLHKCSKLWRLPDSITQLTKLTSLDLSWCSSLQGLPQGVGGLAQLQQLHLRNCSVLSRLPDSITQLTKLTSLNLESCRSLQGLPEGVGGLAQLKQLHLGGCSQLSCLPDSITQLTKLTSLDLSWCSSLQGLPQGVGGLAQLQQLDITDCSKLSCLPDSITQLTKLTSLGLSWCSSLQALPEGVGGLAQLQQLRLHNCSKLSRLPDSVTQLTKLTSLDLSRCSSLQALPQGVGGLAQLQQLELHDTLVCLPGTMEWLSHLTSLDLEGCSSLQGLPHWIGILGRLQQLDLRGCSSLSTLPDSMTQLAHLTLLNLAGCSALYSLPEGVAEGPGDLSGLQVSLLASPPTIVADLPSLSVFRCATPTRDSLLQRSLERQWYRGQPNADIDLTCTARMCEAVQVEVVHEQKGGSSGGPSHVSVLASLCRAWAAATMVSDNIGDIVCVLCQSGCLPTALQQQSSDWSRVVQLLQEGVRYRAVQAVEDELSRLQQQLQQAMDDNTATSLGLDHVLTTLKEGPSTATKQQALRIFKNLANTDVDEELAEAGLKELQLVVYQLMQDAETISNAFARSGANERLPSSAQLLQPGPICEAVEATEHYMVQSVFFVTDRNLNESALLAAQHAATFGSEQVTAGVRYGVAEVRIPMDQASDLTFCALQSVKIYRSWDEFAEALRDDLLLSGETCSPSSELVLFIHGCNTNFKAAVTSAAQLTYHTSIRAGDPSTPARYRTALAFDWASCTPILRYNHDLLRAEASGPKLRDLLHQLTQLCPPGGPAGGTSAKHALKAMHIVAHSMGNYVLLRALCEDLLHPDLWAEEQGNRAPESVLQGLAERCSRWSVSFAAPDAQRIPFTAMLRRLSGLGGNKPVLTLYCSKLDWALWFSTALHQVKHYDLTGRAGYYQWHRLERNVHKYHVLIDPACETVTVAGKVSKDWARHGYHCNNEQMLLDLACTMSTGHPANDKPSPEVVGCKDCSVSVADFARRKCVLPRHILLQQQQQEQEQQQQQKQQRPQQEQSVSSSSSRLGLSSIFGGCTRPAADQ